MKGSRVEIDKGSFDLLVSQLPDNVGETLRSMVRKAPISKTKKPCWITEEAHLALKARCAKVGKSQVEVASKILLKHLKAEQREVFGGVWIV